MSLPGADELFRTTGGGMGLQSSSPAAQRRKANGEARVPGPAEGHAATDRAAGEAGTVQVPSPSTPPEGEARPTTGTATTEPRGRAADSDRVAAAAQAGRRPQGQQQPEPVPAAQQRRRGGRGANRRPSGRERHDEKITVYVSAEELMDLEHARLVLRGEHGLAVDRGRIVREAVAVVLADLESRGDASILVRRLRGR
ncbi:hypothetical protein [Streptomyces sp. DT171]|uniref:hypothetical protein n=1 Tax=Streptomyces sp. DT171 TaxID=3416524 RepID=UPI003CF2B347